MQTIRLSSTARFELPCSARVVLATLFFALYASGPGHCADVGTGAPIAYTSVESAVSHVVAAPDETAYRDAVEELLSGLQSRLPISSWQGSYNFDRVVVRFVSKEKNARLWQFSQFDAFVRADRVCTSQFRTRIMEPGHGLALVCWKNNAGSTGQSVPYLSPGGLGCAATAVVDVRQQSGAPEASVRLYDTTYPVPGIASDVTAAVALMLDASPQPKSSVAGLLRPAENLDQAGLIMIEPYRPDKIPVVMVHGINSDARTWADAANELRCDPGIRSRYQFWFFRYPTGVPVPISAAMLRNSLNSICAYYNQAQKDKAFEQMVLVGHSMGGLLAQLMVTDSGDAFWNSISSRPIDQLQMSNADRQLLQSSLYFRPLPYVKRVVFIATPHRGSELAERPIANFARNLVSMPSDLTGVTDRLTAYNGGVFAGGIDFPTSIDSLKPSNNFLQVMQTRPLYARYNSIIADNGKGGGQFSSDGVVPYWSSHLPAAESEVVVGDGHSCQDNPATIAELHRILGEHLATMRRPSSVTKSKKQTVSRWDRLLREGSSQHRGVERAA